MFFLTMSVPRMKSSRLWSSCWLPWYIRRLFSCIWNKRALLNIVVRGVSASAVHGNVCPFAHEVYIDPSIDAVRSLSHLEPVLISPTDSGDEGVRRRCIFSNSVQCMPTNSVSSYSLTDILFLIITMVPRYDLRLITDATYYPIILEISSECG